MELKPLSSVSSGDGQCHILFLNIMLRIEILCVRLLQIVLDSGSFKSLFLLLALGYNVLVPGSWISCAGNALPAVLSWGWLNKALKVKGMEITRLGLHGNFVEILGCFFNVLACFYSPVLFYSRCITQVFYWCYLIVHGHLERQTLNLTWNNFLYWVTMEVLWSWA